MRAHNARHPGADCPPKPPRHRQLRIPRRVAGVALLVMTIAGSAAAEPLGTRDTGTLPPSPPAVSSARAVTYAPPLAGALRVLRPFEPPPTPYAAGHRGVDLEAAAGAQVGAAGTGRVTFAGQVAGRGVVVIAHPDGIRTEYEPVTPSVTAGQAVARGERLGRLSGQHDQWPRGRCLHWGARRGDRYLDPLALLRPLGPVRLLPWPR
jgi:murein DD-endopeptidase MepM/ murein hydrolase activator NlpD